MVQRNDGKGQVGSGGASGSGGGSPISRHKTKLILGAIALLVVLSALWQVSQ